MFATQASPACMSPRQTSSMSPYLIPYITPQHSLADVFSSARDFTIRGPVTIPSQKGNVDILLTVLNGWKNDIKNSKNMDDVVPDSTEFPWSPTAYELHLTQNKTPERMIWFNVMAAIDKMVAHYKAVPSFQKTVSLCEVYVMDDGLYLEGYITLITAGTTCGQEVETDDRGMIVEPALELTQRAHT